MSETKKKGLFARLREGLSKTRGNMTDKVDEMVRENRKIDEDFYEELEDILVAGRDASAEGIRSVPDVYPHRGPMSGIHAGLLAAREPRALVLAVDMPLVPGTLLAELLEGKLNAFGKRIGAQLFKLAVNDAMLTYLTAYTIDVDQASLDKLRTRSVLDTKQTRGVIDLDEARSALRED